MKWLLSSLCLVWGFFSEEFIVLANEFLFEFRLLDWEVRFGWSGFSCLLFIFDIFENIIVLGLNLFLFFLFLYLNFEYVNELLVLFFELDSGVISFTLLFIVFIRILVMWRFFFDDDIVFNKFIGLGLRGRAFSFLIFLIVRFFIWREFGS